MTRLPVTKYHNYQTTLYDVVKRVALLTFEFYMLKIWSTSTYLWVNVMLNLCWNHRRLIKNSFVWFILGYL